MRRPENQHEASKIDAIFARHKQVAFTRKPCKFSTKQDTQQCVVVQILIVSTQWTNKDSTTWNAIACFTINIVELPGSFQLKIQLLLFDVK